MRRACIIAVIFLCSIFFKHPSVFAQEKNFSTSLTTRYTISTSGQTIVSQKFILENSKPDIFLKQYSVSFSDPLVSNISATYGTSPVQPTIEQQNGTTTVTLFFPDQLVGQGKQHEFTINYQTASIATVTGKVLETHIPLLKDTTSIDTFTVELQTPAEFGQATRILPQPQSTRVENNTLISTFVNQSDTAITAFFGSTQYFNIGIRYNLRNESSSQALAQVAIPPDTSFQRVFYTSLEPRPEYIEQDEDGNWIATYNIPANTTLTPFISGIATVQLDPFEEIPIIRPQPHHTSAQEYWPVGSTEFIELTKQHNSLETQYQYVIDTLQYATNIDLQQTQRLGASQALKQPTTAVCQEYADTFVTLARTSNIPARVLTGYGYTQNPTLRPLNLEGDILHAWAEYFDSSNNIWKPVDPTWQDTTGGLDYFNQFDLNHIVFAINGKSSTIPYPGGSYKLPNQKSKDVEVTIAEGTPETNPNLSITVQPKKIGSFTIPGFYKLSITNETGLAWYNTVITADSNQQEVHFTANAAQTLLPFQTKEIPLFVTNQDWQLHKETVPVTITIPNTDLHDSTNLELTSVPETIYWFIENREVFGMAIGGSFIAVFAGSVLVLRQRRKRSVRRKSQKS